MRPSGFLFDLGAKDFVCRSCQLSLLRKSLQPRWTARCSSSHSQAQSQVQHPQIQHQAQVRNSPGTRRRAGAAQLADDSNQEETLRKLGLLSGQSEEEGVKLKFYQENKGKLKQLMEEGAFGEALQDPGGKIDKSLAKIEQQLGRAVAFFDAIDEELKDEEKRAEDEEDDDDDYDDEIEDLAESEEEAEMRRFVDAQPDDPLLDQIFDNLVKEKGTYNDKLTITTRHWKRESLQNLKRLNSALQDAAAQRDEGSWKGKTASKVWKSYTTVRKHFNGRWNTIPNVTWDLLWEIFAVPASWNTNRMARIYTLATDMKTASIALSDQRQLLAIEAMFLTGWRKEAVENHRRFVTTLGTQRETFMDFWSLGLRMHCQLADLDRAENMLNKILAESPTKDRNVIIPFIRACAASHEPGAADKAYHYYRIFRDMAGSDITIDDYDHIISCFLQANLVDRALDIFAEMMRGGRPTGKMPSSINNPFFVGKWLKRLIGIGDYDGAEKVVLFMMSQRAPPRPIQVNGLIGAWFRQGTATHQDKAEAMGWAMVNARIGFVTIRDRSRALEDKIYGDNIKGVSPLLQQYGPGFPPATLETFSLLAQSYKDRGLHLRMVDLWEAVRSAKIAPDTFMVNELLVSYLKDGQFQDVAAVYRALVAEHGVKPDPDTYRTLWQAMPARQSRAVLTGPQLHEQILASRQLFADMVADVQHLRNPNGNFHSLLAFDALRVFRRTKDWFGMLVALRALREFFGLRDIDAQKMVLGLIIGSAHLPGAMSKGDMKTKKRIMHTAAQIDHFLQRKRHDLIRQQVLPEDSELPDDIRAAMVVDFLNAHLEDQVAELPRAERAFYEVAKQMGLSTVTAEPETEQADQTTEAKKTEQAPLDDID